MQVYLAKKKPLIVNGEEVALKVIFLGNPRLSETSVALLKQGTMPVRCTQQQVSISASPDGTSTPLQGLCYSSAF